MSCVQFTYGFEAGSGTQVLPPMHAVQAKNLGGLPGELDYQLSSITLP